MNTTFNKVKTIDIQAKEWFDKVNGNSYYSARVTINYGMQDEKTLCLPFDYGGGSFYEQAAKEALIEAGFIQDVSFYELKQSGVIIRSNKQTGCKKSEVKQFGLNN